MKKQIIVLANNYNIASSIPFYNKIRRKVVTSSSYGRDEGILIRGMNPKKIVFLLADEDSVYLFKIIEDSHGYSREETTVIPVYPYVRKYYEGWFKCK